MAGSAGRHGRPDEPDDVDAAGESSGVTPETQPLPMVRRDGAETHHVRAVAKRVPSALPALGRDEASDLSASARATADRRRRARETAAGAGEEGAEPSSTGGTSEPAAVPGRPSDPPGSAARSVEGLPPLTPPSVVPRQRPEPAIERLAMPAQEPGEVELVPLGSRSRDVPPAAAPPPPVESPAPPPYQPSVPEQLAHPEPPRPELPRPELPRSELPRTGPRPPWEGPAPVGHERPYAQGGAAGAPPPPAVVRHPSGEGRPAPDIVDAEIVDDGPRPYAARSAQTDEWTTVPPAPVFAPLPDLPPVPPGSPLLPAGTPAPAGPPGPAGPPPGGFVPIQPPMVGPRRRRPVPPPRRVGPPGSPSPGMGPGRPAMPPSSLGQPSPPMGPSGTPDTWETTPLPPVTDEYYGRRRVRRGGRLTAAGWLVVFGVVIALSAAVAVPFLITGSGEDRVTEASPTTGADSSVPGTSGRASGVPVVTAPSATPSPSASPAESTATSSQPTGPASTQPTTNPQNPPPPAPFALAVQAEAGGSSTAWGNGAVVANGVVDYLGKWPSRNQTGWLEFRNIVVPHAGAQYRLRVFYRYENRCDCDPRRLEIRVNGSLATTWSVSGPTDASQEVTVTLGAGNNTIRLTHPSSGSPAIDRIEINRP